MLATVARGACLELPCGPNSVTVDGRQEGLLSREGALVCVSYFCARCSGLLLRMNGGPSWSLLCLSKRKSRGHQAIPDVW